MRARAGPSGQAESTARAELDVECAGIAAGCLVPECAVEVLLVRPDRSQRRERGLDRDIDGRMVRKQRRSIACFGEAGLAGSEGALQQQEGARCER